MLKKMFTQSQLSYFFQIAIMINVIGLLSDVIVYHYYYDNNWLKLFTANLSNLSIFMVCAIFISQAIFAFVDQHRKLVAKHAIVATTIEICISVFFVSILTMDNDLQENFLIFCSTHSRLQADKDYKIVIILIGLIIMLLYNFYTTLTMSRSTINKVSVFEMFRSIFKLLLQKYLIILSFFFGFFHYEKMQIFALEFIEHTKQGFMFDMYVLLILLSICWVSMSLYFLYNRYKSRLV